MTVKKVSKERKCSFWRDKRKLPHICILAIKLRKHLGFSEVDKPHALEKQKLQMDIQNTSKLSDIPLKLYR